MRTALNRRQFFQGSAALAVGTVLPLPAFAVPVQAGLPRMRLACQGMFEDIIGICARAYGTTAQAVLSERRDKNTVRARHSAMYIASQMTDRSLPEIGRRIGLRDHTTVLHAREKYTALIGRDPSERRVMQTLMNAFLRTAHIRLANGAATGRYVY